MDEPRSYIVRIYRRGFRTLSGQVEDTSTSTTSHFRNPDELLALLISPEPDDRVNSTKQAHLT
jgi:hypothetical protein